MLAVLATTRRVWHPLPCTLRNPNSHSGYPMPCNYLKHKTKLRKNVWTQRNIMTNNARRIEKNHSKQIIKDSQTFHIRHTSKSPPQIHWINLLQRCGFTDTWICKYSYQPWRWEGNARIEISARLGGAGAMDHDDFLGEVFSDSDLDGQAGWVSWQSKSQLTTCCSSVATSCM